MGKELSKINESVEETLNSSEFVLKTQQQIAKDFRQHGFEFEANFETEVKTLIVLQEILVIKLGEIAENHSNQWLPLMYTIDISEKKYLQFFRNSDKNWLTEFSLIVIKREAQKVFFREKFR